MERDYKYHYFYKIENQLNGNYYFGIHSTNDIEDGYMGSGRRLKRAYRQFGKENFKKTILKYFKTREQASEYENEVVTESCVLDTNCYNLKIGGDFGVTTGTILVRDENGVFYRIKPDDEDYLSGKYVPFSKGKIAVFDTEEEKYKLIETSEYKNNQERYLHQSKGRITVYDMSGNTMSVNLDDERYLNGELKAVWVGRNHSELTKEKMSNSHRANGDQIGVKNSQYGTCWITNGVKNLKIKKEDLAEYVKNGWVKGRKIKEEHIKRKTDNISKAEVIKLRETGLTWKSIAKHFGVGKHAMSDYRKRNNLGE